MKSIWKVMLAVCCLGMTIGCGTNPSKNENVKETLPALVVNGTQLMNTEGDTVVLHGVSYGWHQFWPRFYNASSVAYLVNDWGAQVLRASMGVDLDSACYVNKPESVLSVLRKWWMLLSRTAFTSSSTGIATICGRKKQRSSSPKWLPVTKGFLMSSMRFSTNRWKTVGSR